MKSEVKITGQQLQMTRIFDAPRQLVFSFWTQANKLQEWSGCKETRKCEITMDFRVGGSFTQKMQIEGAGEFTVTGKYDEIVVPERIAYHAHMGPVTTRVTIEFIAMGDRTKVVLTQDGLPSDFLCKTVSQGTQEAMDKLDRLLATQMA